MVSSIVCLLIIANFLFCLWSYFSLLDQYDTISTCLSMISPIKFFIHKSLGKGMLPHSMVRACHVPWQGLILVLINDFSHCCSIIYQLSQHHWPSKFHFSENQEKSFILRVKLVGITFKVVMVKVNKLIIYGNLKLDESIKVFYIISTKYMRY